MYVSALPIDLDSDYDRRHYTRDIFRAAFGEFYLFQLAAPNLLLPWNRERVASVKQ